MTINEHSPYLTIGAECVACGWCKYNCPVENCITLETAIATIHQDLCVECNRCVHVCPVDAIAPMREAPSHAEASEVSQPESFDVVVIGAGMGGMLAACQLAQAGRQVLLVENLSFLGGRFSGFQVDGSAIPSGALHTIPHGSNGPFAQALRRSGVEMQIADAKMFASFYIDGRYMSARTPFNALAIFPTVRDRLAVLRGLLQSWWARNYDGSFGDWMIEIGLSDLVRTVVDRFFQFALSAAVDDVPYTEARRVIEKIFTYGLPGVPKGGSHEVARQLGLAAEDAGVVIRRNTRAQSLLLDDQHVCGAVLLDRSQREAYRVKAPLIISDIGPGNTVKLWDESTGSRDTPHPLPPPPTAAVGLKLQVLSPKSLIGHDAIMVCPGTQRVAGILQVSNADPSLAPPGKHLLISHQTIRQGADWLEECRLALEDWAYVFGSDFDKCEVLGCSHFPARFPVNWASQGFDLREQPFSEQGLWMVGDGAKPEGLMMVEGVAASAESVVRRVLGTENTSPWRISQTAALWRQIQRWSKRQLTVNLGWLARARPARHPFAKQPMYHIRRPRGH